MIFFSFKYTQYGKIGCGIKKNDPSRDLIFGTPLNLYYFFEKGIKKSGKIGLVKILPHPGMGLGTKHFTLNRSMAYNIPF